MCQTCVDEGFITQEVLDAIDAFLLLWPEAAFGQGHIVLGDQNVGDANIDFCLLALRQDGPLSAGPRWDDAEREATIQFLEELRQWPLSRRLGPNA